MYYIQRCMGNTFFDNRGKPSRGPICVSFTRAYPHHQELRDTSPPPPMAKGNNNNTNPMLINLIFQGNLLPSRRKQAAVGNWRNTPQVRGFYLVSLLCSLAAVFCSPVPTATSEPRLSILTSSLIGRFILGDNFFTSSAV